VSVVFLIASSRQVAGFGWIRVAMIACAVAAVGVGILTPAPALAATERPGGSIVQLPGREGCLTDRSTPKASCTSVRALLTPGPFLGSRAMGISPDGRNLYVASFKSDAIAVFARDRQTGRLVQPRGEAGCVSARGSYGCAQAWGLDGPNSLTVSPDGRFVSATSLLASSVTTYRRNEDTGALTQLAGSRGCISGTGVPGCASARGLNGPDVIAASSDGQSVYVGSFPGSALAVFQRNRQSGQLTQLADEAGCITAAPASGCSTALAMTAIEGLAVSGDGASVFAAAAGSNAVLAFTRDPVDGSLAQVGNGYGCVTQATVAGCSTGRQLAGANAVTLSPDDSNVYSTSLISQATTSFSRSLTTGGIEQLGGALGCVVWLGASGCYPARGMRSAEGIAFSPDGLNAYVAAYGTGGITILNRRPSTGGLAQKPAPWGCVSSSTTDGCERGRGLSGTGAVAVSPNGRFVYATGAKANSITVFERKPNGR
jgi:6-phosphogluconolactonase (cycloisomerase 2 family)